MPEGTKLTPLLNHYRLMMEMSDAELGTDDELRREHGAAERRPIYRNILPLEDLAGISAAVTLYCSSFKKLAEWKQLHTFKHGRKNDIICNLALPFSIQNILRKYVNYAIDEIIEWGDYHHDCNINYQTCAVLFDNHFCGIVWTSDGEIDYRKTALKMLSNPDLEEQEQFKIAASHCLENHMKEMWPLKSVDKFESLIAKKGTVGDQLISYWYHYFENSVHEIPDREYYNGMKFLDWWCYPHVVIYFWKRLPSNVQLAVSIDQIHAGDTFFQKNSFLEMNTSQQLSVLKIVGVGRIIANFTKRQQDLQYAILIWEYFKNTINNLQYCDIIIRMLQAPTYVMEDTNTCNLSDFIDIMWKTTPSDIKRFASDEMIDLLTSFEFTFHLGTHFAMLVSILPNVELRRRQNILHEISYTWIDSRFRGTVWEEVIAQTGRSLIFDKFVKLCIPNSEEQAEFKKKWISSKFITYYASIRFDNGEWDELDEFIKIFESNITNLDEIKIYLLTDNMSYDYCIDVDDWPHTPSHEWKRFCSGIDEESLIAVLTNFREGTNRLVQFVVLVNMLPNFELDSRHIILDKIISSQCENTNIFEQLIIVDNQPLLLHKFIKLCFTSTQEQFEFKKKWISKNVLKH